MATILEFRPRPKVAPVPKLAHTAADGVSIKWCPFCGAPPKLCTNIKAGVSTHVNTTNTASYIICSNEDCGVMTPMFYEAGKQEAIDNWNKRVIR